MTYEQDVIAESLHEFSELQTWRAVTAQHWEEIAELVLPTSRNTFFYGNFNWPGQKKTDRQVDARAAMALERFGAILDSLLTPRNMTWHGLSSTNPYVLKDRAARLWFEEATRVLFKYRYDRVANFSSQNQNIYQSLGAFGTGVMFNDAYLGMDGEKGLRYRAVPVGEAFLRENHQGMVDGICRWIRLTGQQAVAKFGREKLPQSLLNAWEQKIQMPFNFLHRVCPRTDYDPERWDEKGMLYASYYLCLDFEALVQEGGYRTFPYACSRYIQTPGEVYGRGPAMQVLPAIKTINAEKRDFLTQGHRAAAPVLLTTDDGIVDVSFRPGALNKGGWSEQGHPLIGVLPSGNIQITKEMMDEEGKIIDSAFLVDLYRVLLDDPKVFTAAQVVEMMAQRGVLIAPTVGRQQSEYLGSMIPRELDVLAQQRLLPPMPPVLIEAKGEYHVTYSSPLARDQRAQDVAGFNRTLDIATNVANVTGDPSVFDSFDFDTALPEIAQINTVPEKWMSGSDKIAQKRKARADLQQQQMQNQKAPADAALMKAAAAQKKAGLTPGQLGQPVGPQQGPQQ